MSPEPVNYNAIAPKYDERYQRNALSGVARELIALTQHRPNATVLEVGCGTGHWLGLLQPHTRHVYGLDRSVGMLRQAQTNLANTPAVVCGDANHLPFHEATFDMVVSVNALHHYIDPHAFIHEARRLLRPGGALAIINLDPHMRRGRWYLYEYFDDVYATDMRRFLSNGALLDTMLTSGFERAECRLAEHIYNEFKGRAVFESHFLQKYGTSQLALLSDEAYAAGLERIHAAIAEAEANGSQAVFITDQWLTILVGWLGEADHAN